MTSQYWSWTLSLIGVTGLFFVGQRKWWAWGITALNEILWTIYALATKQYGFILGAIAYITIHAHNAHKWKTQPEESDKSK